MLKRNIKSFYLNGIIKNDSDMVRLKEMYLKLLIDEMRSNGYVPVLDLDPQWCVKYNHLKDNYTFQLEVYGVYLGKSKAQKFEGFSGQNFIPR